MNPKNDILVSFSLKFLAFERATGQVRQKGRSRVKQIIRSKQNEALYTILWLLVRNVIRDSLQENGKRALAQRRASSCRKCKWRVPVDRRPRSPRRQKEDWSFWKERSFILFVKALGLMRSISSRTLVLLLRTFLFWPIFLYRRIFSQPVNSKKNRNNHGSTGERKR